MAGFEFPLIATFISAFLAFTLGMIWYHPKVMGRKWLDARGLAVDQSKSTPFPFVVSFLLWMLASTFYSFLAGFLEINDPAAFICLSSLLWVAFAMPPTLMGAIYTGYPFQAVAIDSAYQLAGYYVFAFTHIVAAVAVQAA
jgi:hypothetical protein